MSNEVISGTLNIGSGLPYDIILSETSGIPITFNNNALDIDFIVSGTSAEKFLYYDASTGRLGINTDQPDTALHIVGPCANDGLKIEGTTNCPTGVRVLLLHNPGISATTGSFPASIDLAGKNTNDQIVYYSQIKSRVLDPETSQTSGEILFYVDNTGLPTEIFKANINQVLLGGLNNITGYSYNVIGNTNHLSGLLYINLGSNNSGYISSGLLLGNNIFVQSANSIIVSNNADTSGNNVIIFGNNVATTGDNTVLIANDAVLFGDNNTILGNDIVTVSGSEYNLLIVNHAHLSGVSGVGFGNTVNITGHNNLFVGNSLQIVGDNNANIGSYNAVTGQHNLVYGSNVAIDGGTVISIGNTNDISNTNSGLFIGNNIDIVDSEKTIVIGLNNSVINELDHSMIIGIDNNTSFGNATDLVMLGQNNITSNVVNSLIAGNNNNLSGTINNNVLLGPNNYAAIESNNNIIVGALNNNSGLGIDSQGAISGSSSGIFGILNNTLMIGVNNYGYSVTNGSVFGNKNYVSGNNVNILGSFNNIKNATYLQNIGNSNFVNGDFNNVMGGKTTLIGTSSIVNNPSKRDVYSFGSGNILFGDNEIVVSGVCVGDNNDLYGINNLVYGSNNTIGSVRHIGTIENNTLTINGDVRAYYTAGQRLLLVAYNPVSTSYIFTRLIVAPEGGVAIDYITQGFGAYTTINLDESITVEGTAYGIKDNFDDPIRELGSSITVIVFPYEITQVDSDGITRTKNYGSNNIVLGHTNSYYHNDGLIVGHSNNITGINNVVIGNNISGTYNNSLQIGTNNSNKIYLDSTSIIFNTGLLQERVVWLSRLGNTAAILNLGSNRLGINNSNPSSTLDVSGTVTAGGLRVGLNTVSGYSLIADASGNASWQFPVNLSGVDTGILFKVTDKVASGSDVLVLNNNNKHVNYVYTIPNFDTFDTYEAFTLTPSGLYINETSDDETVYNMQINGSGIGDLADLNIYQDDGSRIILFKTLPQYNALQVFNITGVSGHYYRHTITQQVNLPTGLTGTFLSVRTGDGLLYSTSTTPNSILFANIDSRQSGNNDLKFYANASVLTIGTTGTLSALQAREFAGIDLDRSSDIILSSSNTHGTVFNNAGRSDKLFSIYNSGAAATSLGFHYYPKSGTLAIGVESSETFFKTATDTTLTDWKTHNTKLFVNGTARFHGIQFLENGGFAAANAPTYLRIDSNGMVYRGALDLSTSYSGIFPIYINTDIASRIDIGISSAATAGGPSMGAAGNGSMLVYNGIGWTNRAKGLYLYQPTASTTDPDLVPGMIVGPNDAGMLNSARNSYTFAGTPFNNIDSAGQLRYRGSNQSSRHMLKGRTINNTSNELRTDFIKETVSSISNLNTISLDTIYDPLAAGNQINRSGILGVWNYTINYCGLISPVSASVELGVTSDNWHAVAGKLEGAVLFFHDDSNVCQAIKLGAETQTWRSTSTYSSSWTSGINDPIGVVFNTGSDPKRMAIQANGAINSNILWNCTVDIHQLNHPINVALSGQV